jgi:hypothetical protein
MITWEGGGFTATIPATPPCVVFEWLSSCVAAAEPIITAASCEVMSSKCPSLPKRCAEKSQQHKKAQGAWTDSNISEIFKDVDRQCADCCCDVPTAEIDLSQTKQKPVGIGGGGGRNCTLTCDGIDPS